jgi:hypothetical protein
VPRALLDRFLDVMCDAASLDKVELRGYPKSKDWANIWQSWILSHF